MILMQKVVFGFYDSCFHNLKAFSQAISLNKNDLRRLC